jgi:sensor histidine kinase YesM
VRSLIAAIVGVLLGLANSHFVFDALRNPPEPLRAKAMVVTLLQYSVPIYSVLEFSLIGSLATYLYVDHRDARRMAKRLHEAGLRRTDQARQMLEAQLQTMQARVEPRFLFNTLAQVQDLHQADPNAAVAMLDRLIDYLRAAMPRMRDTSSTVAQETDLVRAYLEIVKLRLGQRLSFEIDIPADAGSARMPPMMMLPLADHAVVYGLEKRQGDGAITISVDVAAGRLRLVVIDRGAGFVPEAQGDGIASIRERLAALYGRTPASTCGEAMSTAPPRSSKYPTKRGATKPRRDYGRPGSKFFLSPCQHR